MPSSGNEYFCRVTFGRSATATEAERVDWEGGWPSLTYAGMVGIQKLIGEKVLPVTIGWGLQAASALGQPIPGVDAVFAASSQAAPDSTPPGQAKK